MIILTIGTMFLLMLRLGMFDEYFRFRETHLLEEHIMQALDDSRWEDQMERFRETHPHLSGNYSMTFGRRRR